MKRWHAVMTLLALTVVVGCGGPTVRTDFDSSADFTAFRTYAFGGVTDVNQGGVLNNSLIRKRLESMVREQLSKKGLTEVEVRDNPDLLVHYWVGVKEKQQVESTGPYGGFYGMRGGYPGYAWGMGYGGVSTYEYKEGTLIVDLVTPSRNELVWRGTIVETLADSREENIQLANEGIVKAFENYPPKPKTP
ncbi:lipoprotein [Nitrospira sp.]|nr:lipoprotein [Nitrospira sp.]